MPYRRAQLLFPRDPQKGKPIRTAAGTVADRERIVSVMDQALQALYETVLHRKDARQEGSYTCYLFEKGLDKILKKCAE